MHGEWAYKAIRNEQILTEMGCGGCSLREIEELKREHRELWGVKIRLKDEVKEILMNLLDEDDDVKQRIKQNETGNKQTMGC